MPDSPVKRLELAVRALYNRWVGQQGDPVRVLRPGRPLELGERPAILLLRQDRIGDVLVSVPVIRALRAAWPKARIDMVMSPNNVGVRRAIDPFVDDVVVYRKSLLSLVALRRRLRAGAYDVVVDLMDNPSSTSGLLVGMTAARYAVGIDKLNAGVYTHVVPLRDRASVHIVERLAPLLWAFGIDDAATDLHLAYPLSASDHEAGRRRSGIDSTRPTLLVNVSGSDPSRMYPIDRTIEVVNAVGERHPGLDIVLAGAPHHTERLQAVGAATGRPVLPPDPSFHGFVAMVAGADMIWTPDTSIVHVAAGLGIPSVVLFRQDDPGLLPWFPYGVPHRSCVDPTGIANITTADVVHAIDALVEEVGLLRP